MQLLIPSIALNLQFLFIATISQNGGRMDLICLLLPVQFIRYIIIGVYYKSCVMDIENIHNRRYRKMRDRKDKFTTARLVKNMINPDTGQMQYEYCQESIQKSQHLVDKKKTEKEKKEEAEVKAQKRIPKQNMLIFEGSEISDEPEQQEVQLVGNQDEKQVQQVKEGKKVQKDKFIFEDDEVSQSDDKDSGQNINLFGQNDEQKQNIEENKSDYSNNEGLGEESVDEIEERIERKVLTPEMRLLENMFVHMQLWREKNFFGGTLYQICLQSNQRMILAAKQISSGFILSTNPDNFQENGPFYLGKAKFNFTHNHMDFFLPGLSPSNASDKNVTPRELIISLDTVTQALMEDAKPRQFQAFILKDGFSYYKDLQGVQKGEQISLGILYRNYEANKEKIMHFRTRKSKWNEKERIHYLNMKGRAKIASVKNFILEDTEKEGADILLLGKIKEEVYNMDLHWPLNTLEASAIALSSFLYKNW